MPSPTLRSDRSQSIAVADRSGDNGALFLADKTMIDFRKPALSGRNNKRPLISIARRRAHRIRKKALFDSKVGVPDTNANNRL